MQYTKRRRFASDRGRLGLHMRAANTDQVLTSPGSRDSKSQIHLDQLQSEAFSSQVVTRPDQSPSSKGQRGGSYGQGLVVNNISSLTVEQRTAPKVFLYF